jgi:hypothetical protein
VGGAGRRNGQKMLGQQASKLGLNGEQLADRLLPDLGLDPAGRLSLDYGRRQSTVGHPLLAHLVQRAGTRLTRFEGSDGLTAAGTVPEPVARPDQVRHPPAHRGRQYRTEQS